MDTFCGVDEAFNSPLKQQLQKYINHTNSLPNTSSNNNLEPYTFDNNKGPLENQENYQNVRGDDTGSDDMKYYIQHPVSEQQYINAQGDASDNANYKGTPVDKLKYDDLNSLFTTDDDTYFGNNLRSIDSSWLSDKKKKHSHSYYIKNFIKEFNDDNVSFTGTQCDDIYKHVQSCNFCKTEIKKQSKIFGNKENMSKDKTEKLVGSKQRIIEGFGKKQMAEKNNFITELGDITTSLRSDIKEIIIIIFIGIIIIFLMDIFAKFCKK